MKCVGMQHLEAVRRLGRSGFQPVRSVYIVFSPDEEIGGHDGAKKLAVSEVFRKMNVGVVLDEGKDKISQLWKLLVLQIRCFLCLSLLERPYLE